MDENTELILGFVLNLEQDEFKKYLGEYRKFSNIDVQKISIENHIKIHWLYPKNLYLQIRMVQKTFSIKKMEIYL